MTRPPSAASTPAPDIAGGLVAARVGDVLRVLDRVGFPATLCLLLLWALLVTIPAQGQRLAEAVSQASTRQADLLSELSRTVSVASARQEQQIQSLQQAIARLLERNR